jgi:hypothetical protein
MTIRQRCYRMIADFVGWVDATQETQQLFIYSSLWHQRSPTIFCLSLFEIDPFEKSKYITKIASYSTKINRCSQKRKLYGTIQSWQKIYFMMQLNAV